MRTHDTILTLRAKAGWFDVNLGELWDYRDLILLMVRRDFVAQYKQTILGPLWYIIQPLFTTVVFTVIFSKVAQIPTDGAPPFLFYLAGNVCWMYFASCLTDTSNTFTANAGIFGKVYFPRLVVPVSVACSKLFQFAIQFALFALALIWQASLGAKVAPTAWALALPLLLLQMALLGLGVGALISSLTTKYRDLSMALGFCVQLWMYGSPVAYPLSQVPQRYQTLYCLNPMVAVIENFRAAFLGVGGVDATLTLQSWAMTLVFLFAGVLLFNRTQKTFMDTV